MHLPSGTAFFDITAAVGCAKTGEARSESAGSEELIEDTAPVMFGVAPAGAPQAAAEGAVKLYPVLGEADHHARPQRRRVQRLVGESDPMSGASPGVGQPLPKSTRVDQCTKARVEAVDQPANNGPEVLDLVA